MSKNKAQGAEKMKIVGILAIVFVMAFLVILPGMFSIVPPGHRGVSVTLGKVDPTVCPEGFNFKKPFIERIVKMPIQQITETGKTPCFSLAGMIDIRDIPLSNVDLSEQLEQAIEAKQVQEQQALAKTYELQKANKEAEITVVNATAEAESVRIKGAALKASPEVIQLEIAKKWNGVSPTTVVVTEGGANVLLPLK